jgi:signal transduction histidine kinase
VVNESRVRALVEALDEPVLVLDSERRLVAASPAAAATLGELAPGRRVGEAVGDALVLFVGALPELSHELRTPLARLLVLLESASLPGSDVDELLEQAQQEVQQARDLIDDVLFLGELETGREVVSLGRTRALPIARETVAAFADRAAHAEVRLEVSGGEGVDLPLRPRMLRVVVENLVANAVRYAGPGSTFRVTVSRSGSSSLLIASDNGVGVEPEELGRLFERFYRADTARSSRGTGLGLAIVKHVVTAAGGTVEAHGAPGRGLEIVCRFPVVSETS